MTGRRDGSSRFGPGKRFGNFGAIGAAWNFAKEDYIKNHVNFISSGKLRGSIGTTGNDQISDYQFMDLYEAISDGYFGASNLLSSKLANANYAWETIKKIEVAVEFGFLNDRILLNTSVYRNRSANQLVGFALPSTTGFNSIIANLPAVVENKGLEIDFSTLNIESRNFKWKTSGNISFPTNKLVSFPGLAGSSYATRLIVGESLNTVFRYKYAGVNPTTGIYTVEDLDKDGTINSTKDRIPVNFGVKYFGGFNNSFSYKGITLDVFFQFVKQTGYRSLTSVGTQAGSFGLTYGNVPTIFLERWQNQGDEKFFQKFTIVESSTSFSRYKGSNAIHTDASFIRCKNVALSWQLPSNWIKPAKMESARLYIQCQNLFTITSFDGMDPENSTSNSAATLPPLRMLTAGIQVSF